MKDRRTNRKTGSANKGTVEGHKFGVHKPFSGSFGQTVWGIGLICSLLFGVTVWLYFPSVHDQFLFHDEFGTLIVNRHVNVGLTWAGIGWAVTALEYNQWIPLSWISHMLDFQFYGSNPWGHHLTNILIHAASTVLLFLALKKMTGALWRSLIVTSIFAFHPLRVESVAWVSERKDVLSVFFGFLALWAYAAYAQRVQANAKRQGICYGLTGFFFACSLLSKQMLITFPCLMLLLDYWPFNRWKPGHIRRIILEKIPFFVVLPFVSKISYLAQLRGGALEEMAGLPLAARLENALISYARYLEKFFFPAKLAPFYAHPGYWPITLVVLAGLILAGISICAWGTRRRWPYFLVGWFWFVGTLVPVIGFVQLYSLAMADRFTYFPCIGVSLVVVWGIYDLTKRWPKQMTFGWVASVLVCLVFLGQTRYCLGFWKDDETILNRAISVDENNYVAHSLLGFVISSRDPARALGEFQKSVAINPRLFQAQMHLANSLLQFGRLDEAITHFQQALEIEPSDLSCKYNWGMACYQKGNVDEAIVHCHDAWAGETNNLQYLNALAIMLAKKERWNEATPYVKKICELNGNDPNAFNLLGVVSMKTGRIDEAIVAFQSALKLSPDSTALQNNLAAAMNAQRQAGPSLNQPPAP